MDISQQRKIAKEIQKLRNGEELSEEDFNEEKDEIHENEEEKKKVVEMGDVIVIKVNRELGHTASSK